MSNVIKAALGVALLAGSLGVAQAQDRGFSANVTNDAAYTQTNRATAADRARQNQATPAPRAEQAPAWQGSTGRDY